MKGMVRGWEQLRLDKSTEEFHETTSTVSCVPVVEPNLSGGTKPFPRHAHFSETVCNSHCAEFTVCSLEVRDSRWQGNEPPPILGSTSLGASCSQMGSRLPRNANTAGLHCPSRPPATISSPVVMEDVE